MTHAFVRHLGAALAACLLLGGCSSASAGDSTSATSAADPASLTGTLRVLTPSYPSSNAGKAALQKVIDAFHARYPQVTVEPDITNFGQLNEKISTSLASGQPYDVYITGVGWIPPFASKGLFADLSGYGVTRQSLANQVNPAIIPAGLYDGKAYGIPLIVSPKPISYRKSLFAAAGLDPNMPPASWDKLRADALRPIQLGLAIFSQNSLQIEWTYLMAGATLAIVPVLLLFVFTQRYFIEGMATAGLKG